MSTQKDRFLNRNFEEEQYKSQLKEKNNQLARYVTEIQLLNVHNSKMAQEMTAMTQELEVAIEELDRYSMKFLIVKITCGEGGVYEFLVKE